MGLVELAGSNFAPSQQIPPLYQDVMRLSMMLGALLTEKRISIVGILEKNMCKQCHWH